MKTIKNESGSKAVNFFSKNGSIRCLLVQICEGDEQVLDSKVYRSEKAAIKWAEAKLS